MKHPPAKNNQNPQNKLQVTQFQSVHRTGPILDANKQIKKQQPNEG